MPRLKVNGLTFHYQQAGEGPDVVLIHGVTGDLSIWFLCNSITELAATHRVTAFDLRGHGYSDVPPSGYTSFDHAGDVLALMDAIGAPRAKLVGHSFGAVVAMHAAVLAPSGSMPWFSPTRISRLSDTWKTSAGGVTGRHSTRKRRTRA